MDIKKLSKTNESGLRKNSDLKYLLYEEINDGKIGQGAWLIYCHL